MAATPRCTPPGSATPSRWPTTPDPDRPDGTTGPAGSRLTAAALQAASLVVDTHTHGPRFVPQPWRALYRLVNRRTMPPDMGFEVLSPAGIDAVVATAVGDPVVTRWYRGTPWAAVGAQLDQLVSEIGSAGGDVALDAAGVRAGRAAARPRLILGVEGADAIGPDLDRLAAWQRRGVRLVAPIHLGHNRIGTTALTWSQYVGPWPSRGRRRPGLTSFGRDWVAAMNDLGLVVDTSHADTTTTLGIVAASRHPVVASHTGARARHDFARYLTDTEALAIAGAGGLIGLWPFFHRGRGVASLDAFVEQARYLAGLVGPGHLCLGTDMNGVPGVMAGYRGETDLAVLTGGLQAAGLSDDEAAGVLGANFLRVLATVAG